MSGKLEDSSSMSQAFSSSLGFFILSLLSVVSKYSDAGSVEFDTPVEI